jgi:hypothetical protein
LALRHRSFLLDCPEDRARLSAGSTACRSPRLPVSFSLTSVPIRFGQRLKYGAYPVWNVVSRQFFNQGRGRTCTGSGRPQRSTGWGISLNPRAAAVGALPIEAYQHAGITQLIAMLLAEIEFGDK